MRTMDDIIVAASAAGRSRLAVAAAQETSVLEAVADAYEAGIACPILVGDPEAIMRAALECREGRGLDIGKFEVVPDTDPISSVSKAVGLVRSGEADFLMKGIVDTSILLRVVLNKEMGIGTGKLASHVAVMQTARYHKLFIITDAAINIAPDLPASRCWRRWKK
ncbi:MAG: phosphate butyryltransferase [Spirochaetes bacterium]|nr:MAG: phosphate butyryltransferase [Spirochaetota bacterium]